MPSRLGNRADIGAGLVITAAGLIGLALVRDLPIGTARAMEAGYVPRAVSAALVALGLFRLARALLSHERSEVRLTLRAPVIVLGSVLGFAVLLKPLGFFLTALLVIVAVRSAMPGQNLRETMALAVGVAIAASVLFVELLQIPVSLWPP